MNRVWFSSRMHTSMKPLIVALLIAPLVGAQCIAIAQTPPQSGQFGPLRWFAPLVDGTMEKDGLHFTFRAQGKSLPWIKRDMRSANGVDHFELQAQKIQAAPGGSGSGTADGDVRLTVHEALPGGVERVIVLTGAHAELSNVAGQKAVTVDVTGSPRLEISSPELEEPAVLSNAKLMHINLTDRTFQITGDDDQQPMMSINPKETATGAGAGK